MAASKNQNAGGLAYMRYALYAFAAFAFEALLLAIETRAYGVDAAALVAVPARLISHWAITACVWTLTGIAIVRRAKKTTGFDIFAKREKMKAWQYVAVAACFAVIVIIDYYVAWGGFKVLLEWRRLGALLFAFQYIYYFAEAFLISLVIIYGEKACASWFRNEKIPYGGIVVGLTWGLAHTFSQGDVLSGIYSAFSGFLFGAAYRFVNKDYKKALPVIALLFVM